MNESCCKESLNNSFISFPFLTIPSFFLMSIKRERTFKTESVNRSQAADLRFVRCHLLSLPQFFCYSLHKVTCVYFMFQIVFVRLFTRKH